MNIRPTFEQETAIDGIARNMGKDPNEIAVALIEAGITWLTAKGIGQPLDNFDLGGHPGTERISVILGAAYRRQATGSRLWTPSN